MSCSIGILAAKMERASGPSHHSAGLSEEFVICHGEFGALDTLVSSGGVSSLTRSIVTTNGSSPRRA